MEFQVSLQYPNGRIHQGTVERDSPLKQGDEFQMHGRRWRAVSGPRRPGRFLVGQDAPMLCRST
jgi:hypothetical protein